VNTAFASRRIEYDVPVNATSQSDIERARRGLVRAIGETDGVLADPRPDVLVVALGNGAVTMRARWWADARVPDALIAQDRVLAAIAATIDDHGFLLSGAPENSAITTVAARATETEGTASGDQASDEPFTAPRAD
jgi:small-conductance mechanosensitive channel